MNNSFLREYPGENEARGWCQREWLLVLVAHVSPHLYLNLRVLVSSDCQMCMCVLTFCAQGEHLRD